MKRKSINVPKNLQLRYDEITNLTDQFSAEKLNEEYAELSRQLIAALSRKRPTPITTGTAKVWACAAIHALGMVNFLYDKTTDPYVSNQDLIEWFGVGQSTASGKSKQIRDILRISQLDHKWMLPKLHKDSFATWMISLNGLIVDVRTMPLEIQEIALEKGLIPYIPLLKENEDSL